MRKIVSMKILLILLIVFLAHCKSEASVPIILPDSETIPIDSLYELMRDSLRSPEVVALFESSVHLKILINNAYLWRYSFNPMIHLLVFFKRREIETDNVSDLLLKIYQHVTKDMSYSVGSDIQTFLKSKNSTLSFVLDALHHSQFKYPAGISEEETIEYKENQSEDVFTFERYSHEEQELHYAYAAWIHDNNYELLSNYFVYMPHRMNYYAIHKTISIHGYMEAMNKNYNDIDMKLYEDKNILFGLLDIGKTFFKSIEHVMIVLQVLAFVEKKQDKRAILYNRLSALYRAYNYNSLDLHQQEQELLRGWIKEDDPNRERIEYLDYKRLEYACTCKRFNMSFEINNISIEYNILMHNKEKVKEFLSNPKNIPNIEHLYLFLREHIHEKNDDPILDATWWESIRGALP